MLEEEKSKKETTPHGLLRVQKIKEHMWLVYLLIPLEKVWRIK